MVNKVILLGNLGQDPEVKYLDNNKTVASVSLATSERYTDRNGNKVENTEWHRLEMWDGLAKVAENYLRKGSKVYIEGSIKTEEWEKDGVKRYNTKIRVKSLQMLGDKPESTSSQPASAANNNSVEQVREDDLPF